MTFKVSDQSKGRRGLQDLDLLENVSSKGV